jgi:glycosyltransferase involved in cell wall biosynthesis
MIVKNEAANLSRCLDSVRNLPDELIIVDTGSSDATTEIAADHGARVLRFDFARTDFAAARNHGLAQASGRWILVLDADETLHPESRARIQSLVAQSEDTGYYFERDNHSAQTTRDYVVRLFPNRPEYRYKGRVHETIDASILAAGGRLHQTTIRLDHSFANDPAARRQRNLRYIEILKEELLADPSDSTRLDFLAAEYHQLEMFDEAALIAEHVATLRPLDARAQLFAGIYHVIYKPDHAKARAEFHRALELRPSYPEATSFLQLIEERELTPAGLP